MKTFLSVIALAGVFLFGAAAVAGNQQASGSTFFPLTNPMTYARGDGLFQYRTNKIPVLIGNGDGLMQIGPQMYDTFAYGDGAGAACSLIGPTTQWITHANQSCVTTCGADPVPVGTCLFGLDAGVGGACATATNDDCLCSATAINEDCGAAFPSSGTALQQSLITFGHGMKLAYAPIVIQTIAPDMDATSLDIGCDQTNNDGLELAAGGIRGSSGRPFVVGEDPAFQFCITVAFEDADGTDDFHMGFRRAENFNATFDNYDDLASIGNISANIYIETIEAGAATTSTDTTDDFADGVARTLCTKVSDAGVVTYTIDGQAPTTTAAYTLTDGEQVIPFVHMLQDAALTGEVDLTLWEVRFQ